MKQNNERFSIDCKIAVWVELKKNLIANPRIKA